MTIPKVTVICRTYNQEEYIAPAISSVLGQSFTDWEMIVINDCSTDKTEEQVMQFKDDRIKYLRTEKNIGPICAFNLALKHARGEYISVLDGDDMYMPNKLELQTSFLDENLDYGAIFSYLTTIDETGREIYGYPITALINSPAGSREQMFKKMWDCYNFLAFPSEMCRKALLDPLSQHLLYIADGENHMKMLMKSKIKVLEIPLINYRIAKEKSISQQPNSHLAMLYEQYHFRNLFFDMPLTLLNDVFFSAAPYESLKEAQVNLILHALKSNSEEQEFWGVFNFHIFCSTKENYDYFMQNKTYADFLKAKNLCLHKNDVLCAASDANKKMDGVDVHSSEQRTKLQNERFPFKQSIKSLLEKNSFTFFMGRVTWRAIKALLCLFSSRRQKVQ